MSKLKKSSAAKMKIGLIHLLSNPNVVVDHFRLDRDYDLNTRTLKRLLLTIQFHNHEKKDE